MRPWRFEKLRFRRKPEDIFNWLNSVSWVELGEVTCRGHVSYQEKSAFTGWRGIVGRNGKSDGFNVRASLRAKHRYQLIVRLKANKCYQELFCYLSSYKFLVLDSSSGLWSSCRYYWQCNRYYSRVCLDCIVGHIALIALTVSLICIALIVSVLGSVLCF